MANYLYTVVDNRIDKLEGEVPGTDGYTFYKDYPFKASQVYYKLTGSKVSNVICEAPDQNAATTNVNQFLLVFKN
jgi:hypothetical protein